MPIQFDDEQPPQLPLTIAAPWNARPFLIDPDQSAIFTPVNYYINATSGNDSNPGTLALPWATITNLNNKFLPPGSTVNFNGGDTFTQTGSINLNASNITGGQVQVTILAYGPNPVVFQSYGHGRATLQFNGNIDGFIAQSAGYLTIADLIIKGDNTFRSANFTASPVRLFSGVRICHGGGGGIYSNININNCLIQNFANGGNIAVNATENAALNWTGGSFDTLTIDSCELSGGWRGVDGFCYGVSTSLVTHGKVQNCYIHDNPGQHQAFDSSGHGIILSQWDIFEVWSNGVFNNGANHGGAYCLAIPNSSRGLIAGYNELAFQKTEAASPSDAGAFENNSGSNQIIFQHNFCHDNNGNFFSTSNDAGNLTTNSICRFNIGANNSVDLNNAQTDIACNTQTTNSNVSNVYYYCNTCVTNPNLNAGGAVVALNNSGTGTSSIDNFWFLNNIVYITSSTTLDLWNTSLTGVTNVHFKQNDYANINGTNISWNGTTYTSVSSWSSASGQDPNFLALDPSVLRTPTGHFTATNFGLLPGSLCVGAGRNLATDLGSNWWDPYGFAALGLRIGAARDFFGNPVPATYGSGNSYYPIGAHQPTNVLMYESFGGVTAPGMPSTGWGSWGPNFTTSTTQHWADSPNSLRHNTATFDQNWTAATDGNNGDSEVSIKFWFQTAAAESFWQISLRDDGTGNNNYLMQVEPTGSAQAGVGLFKIVSGGSTQLGTTVGTTSIALAGWYRMILAAQGSTISASIQRLSDGLWMKTDGTFQVNKTACITATDTSITGSGKASIVASQAGTDLIYATDFLFETLATVSDEAEVPSLIPACATQQQAVNWTAAPFLYDEWGANLKNFAMEDEPPFVSRYIDATWNATAFRDDEASGSLAGVKFDDELPFVAQYVATAWTPVPFRDDEVGPNLANFALEQQEPANPQVQAIAWNPVAFRDDEVSTALANFALEDELPYIARYVVNTWNAVTFLDDEASAHLADMGVDDELPFTAQGIASTWNPVAFRDDETSTNLANFALEDELPFTPQYLVVSWNPVTFRDDEMAIPLGDFVLEQQEPFVPQTMATPWNATTFLDDETLALLGLDDESLYVATTQAPNWNPVVFRDDETFATPPPTIGFDDDIDWNRATISQPWNATAFRDDEVGSQLKNFAVEDELVWTPRYLASLIDNRVFMEDPLFGTGIIPPSIVTQPRSFGGVPPDTFGGGFAVTFVGIPDENFPATGP